MFFFGIHGEYNRIIEIMMIIDLERHVSYLTNQFTKLLYRLVLLTKDLWNLNFCPEILRDNHERKGIVSGGL